MSKGFTIDGEMEQEERFEPPEKNLKNNDISQAQGRGHERDEKRNSVAEKGGDRGASDLTSCSSGKAQAKNEEEKM